MSNEPLLWRKAKPARLVIADDHELARAGLRAMLTGQCGLELVGEAGMAWLRAVPSRSSALQLA